MITCPRCFSKSMYRYGKDKFANQKYLCRNCRHQFTLQPKHLDSSNPNPLCPICQRKTFLWHTYDTYLHFKCNSKLPGHSIKVPISPFTFKKTKFPPFVSASFKRFRFSPTIILTALSLYFECSSSLRQIQRFLKYHFHIRVSHVSIYRWIRHFAAFFKTVSNFLLQHANLQSDEWHADETYIKIHGVKHYLWVLLDSETRVVIAFHLSPDRDGLAALKLFQNAHTITDASPLTIITDGLWAYHMSIQMTYPNTSHHVYTSFADIQNNNLIESFNKTFKAWYKTKKGFHSFSSALDSISNFLFYYNFIHSHSSLSNLSPAMVAGVKYTEEQKDHWFLF